MSAKKKKDAYYGGCSIGRLIPAFGEIERRTKVINICISFEEALKLNLAISESLRKLNSYNRGTNEGRKKAMKMTVAIDNNNIMIGECNLR